MNKLFYAIITFLVLASTGHAATYAQVFQTLLAQQRASGVVLSGGKAWFYSPGTETRATIYTDRNMGTEAANPATLSADGTVAVYGNGQYDVKLTNSAGSQKAFWPGVSLVDASNVAANNTAFINYTSIDRLRASDGRVANIYDAASYSSLPAAVAAIGATPATLRYGANVSLSDNLTIPTNIELAPYNQAIITIASGKVLTINGVFDPGNYKVFDGAGTVAGLRIAKPWWWGGKPAIVGTLTDSYAAINTAISALGYYGKLVLSPGVWLTSDTLSIADTQANSKQIIIEGDDEKTTFLFHTGAQTTGGIKISGIGTWQAAGSFYVSIGGASSVKNISLGSRGGPALYLANTDRNVIQNVKFFSAGAAYQFLRLEGTVENRYWGLDDWGNEILPVEIADVITAAGGAVSPYNFVKIMNGAYDDGSNGSSFTTNQENYFYGMRSQALHSREAIYIERNAGTIDEVNRIHFVGGKFTGSTGSTNYPILYNNGGTQIYITNAFFEPVNTGGVKSSIVLDNQNGDSEIVISSCNDKTSYIDLGAPAGGPYSTTPGANKMSLTMANSRFYNLRNNYDTPHTIDLLMDNVGWNIVPVLGTLPDNYKSIGNYIINESGLDTGFTPSPTSNISGTGVTVTVVQVGHHLKTGDLIKTSGSSTAGYNVTSAAVTKISPNSFSYPGTGTGTPTTAPLIQLYTTRTAIENRVSYPYLTVGNDSVRSLEVEPAGVTVWNRLQFLGPIPVGVAPNNSLYIDSADNKLKFIGNSGTVTILANP